MYMAIWFNTIKHRAVGSPWSLGNDRSAEVRNINPCSCGQLSGDIWPLSWQELWGPPGSAKNSHSRRETPHVWPQGPWLGRGWQPSGRPGAGSCCWRWRRSLEPRTSWQRTQSWRGEPGTLPPGQWSPGTQGWRTLHPEPKLWLLCNRQSWCLPTFI